MATIQWRPEVNAMTTPQSYWIRFLPRNVVGKAEVAARMAKELPNYSEEECRTFIDLHNQIIAASLSNGEQVTEENAFTYALAFTGRLDSPEDALPPLDQCLQVRVHASPPFVEAIRQIAKTERLPQEKKLPLLATAQDTLLQLKNVLNPEGLLRLTGEDLFFDQNKPNAGECVLEGTHNGRTVQTRFGKIEDREIIIMPEIPAQTHPWNNEYTLSVSTHYSEHGTLRTGTYAQMLRSPLTVPGLGAKTGILTGNAESPYVRVTGGISTAEEMLRIQVLLDMQKDLLLVNLLDMQEKDGQSGEPVLITENGEYPVPGFSGSAIPSLVIKVENYAALKEMVRNNYSGRLLDVLQIEGT